MPLILSVAMVHASVLVPSMFMEHEPQMPSRQERRKVSVGSITFFIQISASSTIGANNLRMDTYFVDLDDRLSQLLVDQRALRRAGRPAAGVPLDHGQPRRGK